MSEETLTITTWLARQFFDPHKENGLLVAELDRRLPGPLCSIAAISPRRPDLYKPHRGTE